jgi:periplasmic copper chaperone A
MRLVAAAVAAGLLATACGSGPNAPAALSATGAWARTTPPGATNGVVYMQIVSPVDDAIVAVSVPASVAASAELHETMGADGGAAMPNMPNMASGDGQMTMTPVDSVPLPAGTPVAFEPGGKHIMLVDLLAPLTEGQHLTLTATLKSGTTLPVDVVVANNEP